jgi:hypothetical protein
MLAAEVPAAILAKMLGLHIKAAVQWQQLSSGDWTTYAAVVSQRNTTADLVLRDVHATSVLA